MRQVVGHYDHYDLVYPETHLMIPMSILQGKKNESSGKKTSSTLRHTTMLRSCAIYSVNCIPHSQEEIVAFVFSERRIGEKKKNTRIDTIFRTETAFRDEI